MKTRWQQYLEIKEAASLSEDADDMCGIYPPEYDGVGNYPPSYFGTNNPYIAASRKSSTDSDHKKKKHSKKKHTNKND